MGDAIAVSGQTPNLPGVLACDARARLNRTQSQSNTSGRGFPVDDTVTPDFMLMDVCKMKLARTNWVQASSELLSHLRSAN